MAAAATAWQAAAAAQARAAAAVDGAAPVLGSTSGSARHTSRSATRSRAAACGCSSRSWPPHHRPGHSDKCSQELQQVKRRDPERADGASYEPRFILHTCPC
eukprot:1650567-Prymnesium_polylepis.1